MTSRGWEITSVRACNHAAARRSQGFTIVEIILSLGIVAVLLLSLIALFTRGMVMLGHSKQISAANDAAVECLEIVKASGVAAVTPGRFDGRAGDPADAGTGFPPAPYPRTVDGYPLVVEATTSGAPVGTIAVSVEVYYDREQKVVLQTYLPL